MSNGVNSVSHHFKIDNLPNIKRQKYVVEMQA